MFSFFGGKLSGKRVHPKNCNKSDNGGKELDFIS